MNAMLILITAMSIGLERPDVEFQVFQFPANQIPRIDGDAEDWSIVPDSYAIGTDELRETVIGLDDRHDPKNLDVKVKVGWVKGLNRLYFLFSLQESRPIRVSTIAMRTSTGAISRAPPTAAAPQLMRPTSSPLDHGSGGTPRR